MWCCAKVRCGSALEAVLHVLVLVLCTVLTNCVLGVEKGVGGGGVL